MKKTFIILGAALFFASCGGNGNKNTGDTTTTTTTTTSTSKESSSVDTLGAALIKKNDCLTCHKLHEKLIGPAYDSVAMRYASAPTGIVDTLANKVIKGGSGHWGAIAMSPHPQVSTADAQEMVKYILSIKK
jgi:cytochrome c